MPVPQNKKVKMCLGAPSCQTENAFSMLKCALALLAAKLKMQSLSLKMCSEVSMCQNQKCYKMCLGAPSCQTENAISMLKCALALLVVKPKMQSLSLIMFSEVFVCVYAFAVDV